MKEISVQWCPTKEMVADFWTKPLQGSHFRKLRDYIMGRVRCVKPKGDAGSVTKTVNCQDCQEEGVTCGTEEKGEGQY